MSYCRMRQTMYLVVLCTLLYRMEEVGVYKCGSHCLMKVLLHLSAGCCGVFEFDEGIGDNTRTLLAI